MGKNFRKDVEASSFVGANDDFAARDALRFGNGGHRRLTGIKGFFCKFQEQLAGGGQRHLSTGTVEQSGADLFFERANLGGNRRLSAETLLRGTGEAGKS